MKKILIQLLKIATTIGKKFRSIINIYTVLVVILFVVLSVVPNLTESSLSWLSRQIYKITTILFCLLPVIAYKLWHHYKTDKTSNESPDNKLVSFINIILTFLLVFVTCQTYFLNKEITKAQYRPYLGVKDTNNTLKNDSLKAGILLHNFGVLPAKGINMKIWLKADNVNVLIPPNESYPQILFPEETKTILIEYPWEEAKKTCIKLPINLIVEIFYHGPQGNKYRTKQEFKRTKKYDKFVSVTGDIF